MKKTLLLMLMAAFSLQASAQSNHEKTLKLLKLMGFERNLAAIADNMTAVFNQTVSKSDPEKAKQLSTMISNELKYLAPKLIADMVPIYEKHFTAQELQKYISFYSSPEGMKMINSAPILQKEMMATMMTKYIPEMQKRIATKLQQNANKKRRSI
jgi:hypothetical protein